MELIKLLSSLQEKLMSKNKPDTRYQIPDTKFLGQSLIEVVIAMAVIVGLAVALVTTTLVVQKASRTAKNNTQATKLVQQNIEQVRVYRDRKGYASIPDGGSCYTLSSGDPDPLSWFFSASFDCSGSGQQITLGKTNFDRKIKIETDASTKKVTVTVSWTDSGGTQSVSNQTILSAGL